MSRLGEILVEIRGQVDMGRGQLIDNDYELRLDNGNIEDR